MFQDNCPKCKVCGSYISQYEWEKTRSCTSCQNFYQRSTEKMNSSKTFSYNCTCLENCCAKGSVQCSWSSGKRNHCKQCRYVKYQST